MSKRSEECDRWIADTQLYQRIAKVPVTPDGTLREQWERDNPSRKPRSVTADRLDKPWWDRPISKSMLRNVYLRKLHEQVIAGQETSYHSAMAGTLKLLIARFEFARVPYTVRAEPGVGYVVQRATPEPEGG